MMKLKIIFIFLIISCESYADEYEKIWGIGQQVFINSLAATDYIIFKPQERPEYKNRIISFFNTMGGDGINVNILRINGIPEKDYCFFNNYLYSVSEDWGNTPIKQADSIIKKIENEYKLKNIVTREETIITFEKNKNKIILYKKSIDNNFVKLRIFYYSNDIFNILLKD